jgi:hypothetical protein
MRALFTAEDLRVTEALFIATMLVLAGWTAWYLRRGRQQFTVR